MHSVEMQIHADSKGKVAVDDVTLLLYEVSRKYHFTFSFDSVLCNWVNYSHGITYVLCHPAHSDIIFDPRAITVRGAFVHKI